MLLAMLLLAGPLLVACKASAPPGVTLSLTPGPSASAWSLLPAPASLTITEVLPAGSSTAFSGAWPVTTFPMPSLNSDAIVSFVAELDDGSGTPVMRGHTPTISGAELEGQTLPVLCGRVGTMTTTPGNTQTDWTHATATLLNNRFILLATEDNATLPPEYFDTAFYTSVVDSYPLPTGAATAATVDGITVLLIDPFAASVLDTSTGNSVSFTLPIATPVDFAGAVPVQGADALYVIGATRPAGSHGPTTAVLRIVSDGTSTGLSLNTPREGAAATWVSGVGLFVVGGTSDPTKSMELLAPGSAGFQPVTSTVPVLVNSALSPTASGGLIALGGVDATGAPSQTLLLSPQSSGMGWSSAPIAPATGVLSAHAYAISTSQAILVGDDMTGATQVWSLTLDGSTFSQENLPLHQPRSHAASVQLAPGYVAVLGGESMPSVAASTVELFTPP